MAPIGRTARDDQYQNAPAGGTAVGRGLVGEASGNPTGTYPASSLPGPAPNTAGPHTNDLLNKLDPTVDSLSGGTQVLGPGINQSSHGHGHPQTTADTTSHRPTAAAPQSAGVGNNYAPQHSSHLANKLDPQVDTSTRDNRGAAHHQGAPAQPMTNAPQGTYGPHSSRLANTLDPRVESDLGNNNRAGGAPMQGQNATFQQQAPMGYAPQGTAGGPMTNTAQDTSGPHGSRLANVLDPRVEFDRDNRSGVPMQGQNATFQHQQGPMATAPQGQNATFQHQHGPMATAPQGQNATFQHQQGPMVNTAQDTSGPHGSRLANALDPRVESDSGNNRAGAPAHGLNTTVHQGPAVQPGPASKTAGPHSSNILNKLDPSVDSKATVTQQREYRTA